ncbi:MAG: hypothetical protein CfClM3_1162 [Methanobrevibacter sp. CfCl-M3]
MKKIRKIKKAIKIKKKDEVENSSSKEKSVIKKKVLTIVKNGEKNKTDTLKKINRAINKFDEKNLDKVNLTNPDAHYRPNKQNYFQMVHNFQIIGDLDSRFIIDNKNSEHSNRYKTINTFNGRIARRYRFS